MAVAESHFLGELMCPAVQAPPPTCGVNFELMVIFAHSDAFLQTVTIFNNNYRKIRHKL